jgi:U5 small nuclear ribonucleoprotein component
VDDEGAIVLHEDKNYYPDAQEVYPGVNTVLLDEDAQDLTEPLLKPVKAKTFSVLAHDVPELVRRNMRACAHSIVVGNKMSSA